MSTTSMHLLLVDDSPDLLASMSRWLGLYGYRVTTACGVQRAIEALEQVVVDGVLTDTDMPHGGGLALLAWIEQERPGLRVCFMSGMFPPHVLVELHARNIPHLSKPVDPDDLARAFAPH